MRALAALPRLLLEKMFCAIAFLLVYPGLIRDKKIYGRRF
jgi:hypothetical protein